ncbi:MAG: hypothetical protein KZQ97_11025 [Candidatus Thiodiazotropha sp. (ex Dulcina madagascariensis)]|nr:hypothetical protein [Candidatus Thiodiazotropha sp. (ex Dulcina madagascariensis)]
MLWCRNVFTSLICFSMLLASLCAHAEEEIEDFVDIYESNAKIIAVLEGRKSVSFKLLPKETVLWRFGLAAGNSRFTEIRLRVRETVEAIKTTSSKATIRTPSRLLTFEAAGSRWNEHRL